MLLLSAALQLGATTYYVSPSGSDASAGTSAAQAWRSIDRVNAASVRPGDEVLFEGNKIHTGSLFFDQKKGGTPAAPIVISSYGDGQATIRAVGKPIIDVYNAAGFRISNLRLAGPGRTAGSFNGISFYMDIGDKKLPFIELLNLDISGFGGHGILIGAWAGKGGFTDMKVVNVASHDNGMSGMTMWGSSDTSRPGYAHANLYVGHSKFFNNAGVPGHDHHSGDGIVVSDLDGGVIERSVAYNNGFAHDLAKEGPVGIWGWDVNRLTIQYNESFGNRTGSTTDGGGFDLDGGARNSVMQFNYSHDNDGAGYLLCQFPFGRDHRGNVVRYNISQNDGRKNGFAGIQFYSTISDAGIYNNTIFMSPAGGDPSAIKVQGTTTNVLFRNNILMTAAGSRVLDISSYGLRFEGNDYWTGTAPFRLDWNGSVFGTLNQWRQSTGQERTGSTDSGMQADPQLQNAGQGPTLGDADLLSTLAQYRLRPTSPLVDKGLSVPAFGSVPSGQTDFYGNSLGRDAVDIGVHELATEEKVTAPSGMIAHWKLDETSGSTIVDASGNGYTGFLAGNPFPVPGRIGSAFSFDGIDDYISVSSNIPRVESSNFTLSAWVNPLRTPPGYGGDNDAYYGIVIKSGYHTGLYYSREGRFGMGMWLAGEINVSPESSSTFAPGQWYHVTGVVDRAAKTTAVFVNGVLQGVVNWPSGNETRWSGDPNWKIGIAGPGWSNWAWPANASIDDVRIYNRALTPAEIASLSSTR